ncbi:hypothetical protein [Prescottella agglutinans]|uniref:DUF2635 domain-containing protein n=1 Tax=Prescottella agglutinans TaxID=1644129 RepID=A0ABT6M5F6_9NOCA|nr:hypothetical protein [Prescottella agglutinans]MDH6279537.1 hypothetical protein [Prescottella agglutinans]
MTSIRVRAEQTTVDWERGSEFDVERTPFVDRLIADGRLTTIGGRDEPTAESEALGIDPDLPFVPDDGAPPDAPESEEADKPATRRRRVAKEDDA